MLLIKPLIRSAQSTALLDVPPWLATRVIPSEQLQLQLRFEPLYARMLIWPSKHAENHHAVINSAIAPHTAQTLRLQLFILGRENPPN